MSTTKKAKTSKRTRDAKATTTTKRPTESRFLSGTRAVEDIHRTISDLPFQILDNLGVAEKSTAEVKRIHDESLAAVYDTVREVGKKIVRFADENDRPAAAN